MPSEPTTVDAVDLPRYLGTWYEIARLPMRHEPAGFTDITATYSLRDDGRIAVDNRARNGDGGLEQSSGVAEPVEGSGNSKLEVSFLPEGLRWIPFTKGDYWILRLSEDYDISLVGSPDRKYLWLLSRKPSLDEATRTDYLATAQRQGFDLTDLIHTPHTGNPAA
ncbi:MAG TPA: lipocalin family protein [Luteimonas sp.]|nr:lipocalin family protein [Luteimonas sp.]